MRKISVSTLRDALARLPVDCTHVAVNAVDNLMVLDKDETYRGSIKMLERPGSSDDVLDILDGPGWPVRDSVV